MRITIFLPLSRPERLDTMIKQITDLRTGGSEVNFVSVVDNPGIMEADIKRKIKKYACDKEMVGFGNALQGPVPGLNIQERRQRIANVFNLAQRLIPDDTDLVLTIEDDSDINRDLLIDLVSDYQAAKHSGKKIGFVSGVQVGRWAIRMIGAWKYRKNNDLEVLETIPFEKERNLVEIDAAGLYGFLTSKECFCLNTFKAGAFGPDVYFGLDLKKDNYVNYVNMQCQIGHNIGHDVLYPDEKVVVAKYKGVDGRWTRIK